MCYSAKCPHENYDGECRLIDINSCPFSYRNEELKDITQGGRL